MPWVELLMHFRVIRLFDRSSLLLDVQLLGVPRKHERGLAIGRDVYEGTRGWTTHRTPQRRTICDLAFQKVVNKKVGIKE